MVKVTLENRRVTIVPENAMAQPYSATEGKELAPSVREIALGKRQSMIPAFKTVSMRNSTEAGLV
jgi:hypothetical protein